MPNSADFHPAQFLRRVPYADFLVANPKLFASWEVQQKTTDRLWSIYDREFSKSSAVATYSEEWLVRSTTLEIGLAHLVGRYVAQGSNCFLVGEQLQDMLERTDLRGVRKGDLSFPFDCLFVRFSRPMAVGIPSRVRPETDFVTGAYLNHNGAGLLQILLVMTEAKATTRRKHWWQFLECKLNFGLDLTDRSGNLEDEVCKLGDIDGHSAAMPGVVAAVSMISNFLCYLSSPSVVTRQVRPDDTPAALLDRVKSKRPALRATAQSSLSKNGYSLIHIADVEGRADQDAASGSGREMPAHWRRGHWRHRRSETGDLISRSWIKPTVVRADRGQPEHGHVYAVDA